MCIRDRDYTVQSSGQLKTRLEAFAESLSQEQGQRKERKMGKGYFAGIDSGSTSTDVVILDKDRQIVTGIVLPTGAGAAIGAEPVSYTHLDVYKRQMEVQMRKALSRLGKSGAGLRKEIALQKAFLDAASCYPVTALTRKYFEKYRESGLGCLARNLVWTFDAQDAESVEEMKKRIRAAAAVSYTHLFSIEAE